MRCRGWGCCWRARPRGKSGERTRLARAARGNQSPRQQCVAARCGVNARVPGAPGPNAARCMTPTAVQGAHNRGLWRPCHDPSPPALTPAPPQLRPILPLSQAASGDEPAAAVTFRAPILAAIADLRRSLKLISDCMRLSARPEKSGARGTGTARGTERVRAHSSVCGLAGGDLERGSSSFPCVQ